MIIEKIGTGATTQAAYEEAIALLAAPEDAELHNEVIQEAKKKFLGLKVEPAKVRVWYEIPDKKPESPKSAKTETRNTKPVNEKPAAKEKKPVQKEQKTVQKESSKAQPEKVAKETKPAQKLVEEEISENDNAAKYLKMLIDGMGISDYTLTLSKKEDSNEYVYTINCDDDGALIGRRGETLDAIQYLLRLSINKGLDDDKHRKVSVNIGNYREKRNDNLKSLAARSAKLVLKFGRNVVLDPMNPYERRIIHTAIQEINGVTSYSTGQDAGRRVIIALEEGVQPTHPRNNNYRRDGRRDNRGRNPRSGGYQKKEPYKPAQTREPRKDSAGSLYGKIEIPTKTEE